MKHGGHFGKVPPDWAFGCVDLEAPAENDGDARAGEGALSLSPALHAAKSSETAPAVASCGRELSKALNVVFVTIADLPEGGGNTTRLKMLATAVSDCGHQVVMLNEHGLGVAPRELLKTAGRIGGVEYRYILGSI